MVGTGDVDTQARDGSTPLHWAAAGPRVVKKTGRKPVSPAVKVLLSYGADPNKEDRAGYRPLHWAARKGRMVAAHMLLEAQADSQAKARDGLTAMILGGQNGHGRARRRDPR